MPTAVFIQEGCSIDYTPGANVAPGDVVVQGDLIGVAKQAIAANALGSLAIEGVFDFPKQSGVGTAIGAGVIVYWDVANVRATTSSGAGANRQIGKTVKAASDTDTKVRATLSQ